MTSGGLGPGVWTRFRNWERQPRLLIAAVVYLLPALVVYGAAIFSDGTSFLRDLGVLRWPAIGVALLLFCVAAWISTTTHFIPTTDAAAAAAFEFGTGDQPNRLDTEYQELNAEIRWRDQQVTRMSYLLFATLGILAAVYNAGTEPEKPLVTVFGTFLTVLFLVSVTSKIGALRTLRERRQRLEEHFVSGIHAIGHASTVMTGTDREVADPRPFASRLSASSISIYLHWMVLALWVSLYLLALIYATDPI